MIVLGIDAASTACSAAVVIDGGVAAERFAAMERGQAEALVPMIAEALKAAGVAVTGLGAIAVTVGPGAFTGVRIGLAAARGLAVAAGLPCVGVTTFEAVAEPVIHTLSAATLVAAIESKREEIFLQAFNAAREPLGEAFAAVPEDAAARLPAGDLVVAGDAAERLVAGLGRASLIAEASGPPRAAFVAMIGARRVQAGAVGDLPRPFYLRPPDARPMMDVVKR
ncbi:MAG TPA: tRNA (adenosine(37)-N6)-threonylcarbamoyltransferase complex dimerization subunit type 1 TsaB [Alphaproteobacteria bacterium]|jgi:tRNA threonylcarbamoyladenosine biosynthesis protein TsaB|nr:tRNA (adenosine(37)-N6)-threonylcarbamoyltransferase complex dimerization subunit type 1 TsaB [Alphaproteobacteria bacterium]